ncbi:MAG: YARHG domain-containing protein, partial [Calditrichota bacterium]
ITNHLLEVETKQYDHSRESSLRYDTIETVFRHWIITDNGEVELFKSNRYYDFTKVLKIDERHLGGCFIRSNPDYDMNSEIDYDNLFHIKTKHLSIDDLDLMRNEIFADYGYRFKSEKWQNYFAKKPWYKPRYDDVNDQLTEIDKANIQFILKIKKQMVGNEDKYTRPESGNYFWAG